MRTRTLLALLLLLTFASTATAKLSGGGATKTVADDDWYRHPTSGRYYTEAWTTVLRSAAGDAVYVTFLYSNIGVVSGNTAVNVAYAPAGKKAKHYRWNHGTGDYAENPATGRIVIGPNSLVRRGREYTIEVKEEGFALDLVLTAWTDGAKAGDGRVYFTDDKSEWMQTYFHVPRGSFRGTLKAGAKSVALTGEGYLDHTVQNVLSTDYSAKWWTLRLFAPDHTVAFVSFTTPKERGAERVMRMMVTDRTQVLAFGGGLRLRTGGARKDPEGYSYDTRYTLSYKGDGLGLEGTVKGGKLHDREAFMENLNALERVVAESVAGNPIVYRMHADATLTLTLPDGKKVPVSGPAVIESIIMKDDAVPPEEDDAKGR